LPSENLNLRKATEPSPHEVFSVPSYTRFWIARVFSALSYQMIGVAVGWQIYELTHSTFALGMVGLAQFAPLLLLTLVVGHVADRVDRRRILVLCRAIEALVVAGLAIATFTHHIHAAGIFCAVAIIGAARAFENPSTQAMVPNLVPENMVQQAIVWSSSANQTASIIGPALGGFLYVAGPQVPYTVAAVLFMAASLLCIGVQLWERGAVKNIASASSIFSGIHYIRDHKNILGAISLDLFAVLLGGATALLPAYAHDILHAGPWALGLLRLSPAIGALSMSVILAHYPIKKHAGLRMFTAVIIFGLATIAFAFSRSVWLSMIILVVLGSADLTSVVVRSSLVQLETPDEMRGRVSAVNTLFIGTSNQLGEFESGITASWFGLIPATIVGGVGSIIVALLWMRLFPGLRNLDKLPKSK
jgi:MFS family permease